MRCTVELLGVARLRAARRAVEVRLGAQCGDHGNLLGVIPGVYGIGVADALRHCARRAACPALVGPVLTPDGRSLCTGYLLNRNGRVLSSLIGRMRPLADGDRLLLISSAAGGGRLATAARR